MFKLINKTKLETKHLIYPFKQSKMQTHFSEPEGLFVCSHYTLLFKDELTWGAEHLIRIHSSVHISAHDQINLPALMR